MAGKSEGKSQPLLVVAAPSPPSYHEVVAEDEKHKADAESWIKPYLEVRDDDWLGPAHERHAAARDALGFGPRKNHPGQQSPGRERAFMKPPVGWQFFRWGSMHVSGYWVDKDLIPRIYYFPAVSPWDNTADDVDFFTEEEGRKKLEEMRRDHYAKVNKQILNELIHGARRAKWDAKEGRFAVLCVDPIPMWCMTGRYGRNYSIGDMIDGRCPMWSKTNRKAAGFWPTLEVAKSAERLILEEHRDLYSSEVTELTSNEQAAAFEVWNSI